MNIRILAALLRKEVSLMKRNRLIPKIVLIMPFMVMLVIPLVASLEVKKVNVAVVDNDRSILSRRIISDIDASETLDIISVYGTHSEAIREIEKGNADVLVTIPRHYSKDLGSGLPQIDIEANGVNATKGMLGSQYAAQSMAGTISQWRKVNGAGNEAAETSVVNLYNPTLDFRNYMIPALMAVLLIIMCGFLPTLNLVSEKESGTIEAINVTPVSKLLFILSKLIPFWIIGLIVVTIGMTVGWIVYGLAPAGSIWLIYSATILFSLVMSGLSLSIAAHSSTMLQSILVMFAFIIIFQMMSGLFTPVSSMPQWAQYMTYAIPPRYFIEIMRSVYLKGTPFSELAPQFAALTLFAIILCGIAAISYRKRN